MFTGIIEELGKIKEVNKTGKTATLNIECKKVLERNKNRR